MLKHIYLRIMNVQKTLKNKKINEYNKNNRDDNKIKQELSCITSKLCEENVKSQKKNDYMKINFECNINKNTNKTENIENKSKELSKYMLINNSNYKKIINRKKENHQVDIKNDNSIQDNLLNKKNDNCENFNISKKLYDEMSENNNLNKNEFNKNNILYNNYNENNNSDDNLKFILNYSSIQVLKSLNLNYNYINCKDFFMSLSLICNQLAIHKFDNKKFWYILSLKLTDILKIKDIYKTFCIRWLALILNSFARVNFLNKNFMKTSSYFIQNYKNEDIHSFDISQIVNSFSKLSYIDPSLFSFLEKFIYDKIDKMSCQSISNICNAYSKLDLKFEKLFFKLSIRIKKDMDKFNEQEIANIINSYSKLSKIDFDLFNKFLDNIYRKFYDFKPIEIVMITNAYSKCNIYNKCFFSHLFSYITKNSKNFHPTELSILANSYAKFNLREIKIFEIIKKGIIKKENMLDSGNVAMLLHAYGKLLIREEYFILNLLKKKSHLIDLLDCRNLTLFYVSLIKLNIDIPIYIYNSLKLNIIKKLNYFTDLALVSICYSSMFYKYFDIHLISSILILLNKRKARSRSFSHQIHVSLFVLLSLYDFYKFSLKFLICLYTLLNRASEYFNKPNYYDINKSTIQKRIFQFFPKQLNIQSEVAVGPFVVDFLLLNKNLHEQYIKNHKSIK
ncbi:conserved Plasmodium protein, unknown function [Plasmodium gallinaceum]|uniref:RNA-editing substrate-binding complex 6 protein domain-containing protein n=1 Tax=Plasmodium gallinaceum TaxID=5849 RepID=A0A1J1GS71_PLAGA|nr:conserved Plasmodium protein, unknown function [Plasmodium gallinaceum]CRG95345.1 conserved Plasmodium protein, unknown function [Plasmodium gallinaceum]